jgi:hypothetical protein
MKSIYFFLLIIALSCTSNQDKQYREYLNLAGEWQFALDTLQEGEQQQWYLSDLEDQVSLPGTTDLDKKGFLNDNVSTMRLNRVYTYEGIAWYRKNVVIPQSFEGKHLELSLERTKTTKIWIDSIYLGTSQLLQSPQKFDVSNYLAPGEHSITIQVNNDLKLTPYGNVHIYSDETQTNWNGIIGRMFIEATAKTYISGLQVHPDVENKKIDIELMIDNQLDLDNVDIELQVEKTVDGETTRLRSGKSNARISGKIALEYDLGADSELWDEFEQPLYTLTAVISNGRTRDSKTVPFGMRKFEAKGTQFSVNGRTTFLRGKHDACVFPITGFPPMSVEGWVRVYQIAKSYGINHYRFHSYCPPEAAFTAADQEGIYLQAEIPFWGELKSGTLAAVLREEGMAMLDAYANHPSFVMFSHGNEIGGPQDLVDRNITELKKHDNRPLYTMGSNNGIGYIPPTEHTDFFVGARTPYAHDTILTHVRLTHAFADSRDGGILNTFTPSTEINFDYPVSQVNMPVISHEIAQYQVFPDYNEIDKYTGVVRARNLEVFRGRLEDAGMLQQDSAFQQASGAWSAICYKAEMEAALRTGGLAGFQLLDLQDFPGQGTALVGVLDAFMDSKQVITPEAWKQSCNDVVVLAEFPKYCWTTDEEFAATIKIANYSNKEIADGLVWQLKTKDDVTVGEGTISGISASIGGLTTAGQIKADLASVSQPEKLSLNIAVSNSEYSNSYPVWVYGPVKPVEQTEGIIVAKKLDMQLALQLEKGEKVLLFPRSEDVSDNSYPGLFPPDFWNWGMFKGISERNGRPVSPGTLGILTDPHHPIFDSWPTDFHTNWQWFSIIKASNSLILDDMPDGYLPIVQVVDNMERNNKLGLIFEFKVGNGKLLVCMSRLDELMNQPEAVQLYRSMISYMNSDSFDPEYELTVPALLE